MDKADRIALIVAAQVQCGMLEHTYWADLIVKAVKVDAAIQHAAKSKSLTVRELDEMIGDRHR